MATRQRKTLQWVGKWGIIMMLIIFAGCAGQKPPPNQSTTVSAANPSEKGAAPSQNQAVQAQQQNERGSPPRNANRSQPSATQRSSRSDAMPSAEATNSRDGANPDDQAMAGFDPETIPLYGRDGLIMAADEESAGSGQAAPAGSSIEFNFDNADLSEVIRTLAEILNIQYIADPDIQGQVTIHSAGGMARDNLYPIFFKILEINGLTAVKDGPLYRITPLSTIARLPISMQADEGEDYVPPQERVVIQVIPLRHISVAEMTKLITPFVSEGATIIAHDSSNTLLVVDRRKNIVKILRLVKSFDISLFAKVHHRFYFLKYASTEDTANVLRDIFSAVAGDRKDGLKFVAINRLNAVLAVSADPGVFPKIDQMILQLDVSSSDAEPQIYVYFVKNGTADDLSELLNQVFTGKETEAARPGLGTPGQGPEYDFLGNPFSQRAKAQRQQQRAAAEQALDEQAPTEQPPAAAAPPTVVGAAASTLRGEVAITPDQIRNALIIEATPADYRVIENILNRIDVLPRQVLIEATIAEITLDSTTDLGLEWQYARSNDFNPGLDELTISGDTGLSYAIAFSSNLLNQLNALATKNKVNILSSPHVLASDNKEARIDVSNEIPIVSSETVISSSAEPLVTTDIQYRDTGVLLAVTPHINENGLVTMDVFQEVSEQADNVLVAGQLYPSFFKRAVTTTLTVKHGQTIVLGGLIRENKSRGRRGVPYLVDLPIIGFLFGSRTDSFTKTELIILLTPRVIINLEDVEAVTEEFERKVGGVVDAMRIY